MLNLSISPLIKARQFIAGMDVENKEYQSRRDDRTSAMDMLFIVTIHNLLFDAAFSVVPTGLVTLVWHLSRQ